jgi:hypothetical protein
MEERSAAVGRTPDRTPPRSTRIGRHSRGGSARRQRGGGGPPPPPRRGAPPHAADRTRSRRRCIGPGDQLLEAPLDYRTATRGERAAEFIAFVRKLHDGRYDYTHVGRNYVNGDTKVTIARAPARSKHPLGSAAWAGMPRLQGLQRQRGSPSRTLRCQSGQGPRTTLRLQRGHLRRCQDGRDGAVRRACRVFRASGQPHVQAPRWLPELCPPRTPRCSALQESEREGPVAEPSRRNHHRPEAAESKRSGGRSVNPRLVLDG